MKSVGWNPSTAVWRLALLLTFGSTRILAVTPTFNRDVAPIIFKNCTPCHQPQQPGPFNLLGYEDFQKRARQIRELTSRRVMPPWLPEAGYGEFKSARRLSDAEIRLIQDWVDAGSVEGDPPKAMAVLPVDGWQWGEPDLAVTLDEPFLLPESGPDVWRTFVIRAPLGDSRFVESMEFRPGNKAVHHAAVRLDSTPRSRTRDATDPGPGFGGITLPETARPPAGHMLNWLPGRIGYRSPPGLAWPFEKGADLVVQLHMQTTGKAERISPRIGFRFTASAPTNQLFVFPLMVRTLDIPAGEPRYKVRDSYVLPVASKVLWVNPHAHFLGREMKGYARLPDQSIRWLFWIKQWNFNWQDDYAFREPLELPQGSEVFMEYVFDNSPENIFNPSKPPRRVQFGQQSTDEMAELWIQLLPSGNADRALLQNDFQQKSTSEMSGYYSHRLRLDPSDAKAHARLGYVSMIQGRKVEAEDHFLTAIRLDPKDDDTRLHAGIFWMDEGRVAEAEASFAEAVRLNPANDTALGILGYARMKLGDLRGAEESLNAALKINPSSPGARENLRRLERLKQRATAPATKP